MRRVRDVVVGRADLDVAFLYLRDHHPAVALVGTPAALSPGSDAVADVVAATGIVYGEPMTVVAMNPDLDVLDALLGVAPPLGAGGALEADLAAVAAAGAVDDEETEGEGDDDGAPGRRAAVRAVAGLVDAALVVPTRDPGPSLGDVGGTAVRLDLPAARRHGEAAVGVFTSLFAQYHSVGPRPSATVAGWAVVEALADDTDLVVDPGLPWAWRPHRHLLRQLASRRPLVR
ncbi:MAG TPA: hypothetical protein VGO60_09115 [Iamia sp.]|nr:hypothetical protein [Iamia sp.]